MSDTRKEQGVDMTRRKLLHGSAAAGAGVLVAAVAPEAATAEAAGETTGEERKEKGYRLTEHVLAYYKSAAS